MGRPNRGLGRKLTRNGQTTYKFRSRMVGGDQAKETQKSDLMVMNLNTITKAVVLMFMTTEGQMQTVPKRRGVSQK